MYLHYTFLSNYYGYLNGQTLIIVDKESKKAIPFASIEIYEMQIKSNSDADGRFDAKIILQNTPILVSSNGYKSKSLIYKKNESNSYTIELEKAQDVFRKLSAFGLIKKVTDQS